MIGKTNAQHGLVTGVKGNAESVYRTGDINITPENIGASKATNVENGTGSHSVKEGYSTTASGYASHAEGYIAKATGGSSHAEGEATTASGDFSHAEGDFAKAIGNASHAEGSSTTASGNYSHAEGTQTTADGNSSHAEGDGTTASGSRAHAQNFFTIAQRRSQTAIGEYNIADTSGADSTELGDYSFIIGNGTLNARSNALTVDWLGGIEMYLDHNGTASTNATSGEDKDLFNAIRARGYASSAVSGKMLNIKKLLKLMLASQ